MLVLQPHAGRYRDDQDPNVFWVPPDGLAPVVDATGTPQVYVARGPEGGVLTLRLQARWPALGSSQLATRHDSARFRLRSGLAGSRIDGAWHTAVAQGPTLIDRSIVLDSVEAAMIRRLAAQGGDTVDIEVELALEGALPSFPWIVRVDGPVLQSRLAAVIGAGVVSFAEVLEAFAGLGPELFEWLPLRAGAIPPPLDATREALAHHAAATVFVASTEGWQLRGTLPPRVDISLAVTRTAVTPLGLRWSLSEFIAAQPDPTRHLIDALPAAPFEAAHVHIASDVVLADDGIRRIEVELTTGSPSGRLHHAFERGGPSAAVLRYVRSSAAPLALQYLLRATVTSASGPTIVETPLAPTGPVLDIRASSLGLVALQFIADPIVFTRVATLEVKIGSRTLALTGAKPRGWAVGRTPPASVEVTAVDPAGTRHALGPFALDTNGRRFGPIELGIGEPSTVALMAPDSLWARAAYLAVQVEGGAWHTVERGATIAWPAYRHDRFTPPRLRYRTRHVPRDATGRTLPIAESAFRDASGDRIDLELPA